MNKKILQQDFKYLFAALKCLQTNLGNGHNLYESIMKANLNINYCVATKKSAVLFCLQITPILKAVLIKNSLRGHIYIYPKVLKRNDMKASSLYLTKKDNNIITFVSS